ncbi:MAG: hypothetical protein ABR598_00685 [Candidatus Dormibacteria bacterium]
MALAPLPPGGDSLVGPEPALARAIREIRAAEVSSARRRLEFARRRALVDCADRLVEELEEMHLAGGQRVPVRMVQRISRFLACLPPDCRRSFPLRTRIAYVIDNLFEVEDLLLNRIVPGRDAMADDDGPDSPWPAS